MLPFERAFAIAMDHAFPLRRTKTIPLINALGHILAQDVIADRDVPPFDKSAMDGYACRRQDLRAGAVLRVIEEVPAGYEPRKTIAQGTCARVLTGAPVPHGADCVIMQEQTTRVGDMVTVVNHQTASNICRRGEDFAKDSAVLKKGTRIGPSHIAVMATCGVCSPLVMETPSVAVLSTGRELVEPHDLPQTSAIRNSNAPMLLAQLRQMNIMADYRGIVDDTFEAACEAIRKATDGCDVVIISGGVSTGDFDLVPQALQHLGFSTVIQSVAMQPGRPTHLAAKENTTIWGLPGNPASVFVVFELMVKPFLYRMMEHDFRPVLVETVLSSSVRRRSTSRQSALPVRFESDGSAAPVRFNGSADIRAITEADGLLIIPQGVQGYEKGDRVRVRLLRQED